MHSSSFRALAKRFIETKTVFSEELKPVILAQWSHESARGNSLLAKKHMNFAGMKYRKEIGGIPGVFPRLIKVPSEEVPVNFAYFPSLDAFIRGYSLFIQRSPYKGWEKFQKDPEGYIRFLKKSGYATDPNYVSKTMARVAEIEEEFFKDKKSKGDLMDILPSWWKFFPTEDGTPVLVAFNGGTPLFKITTKSTEDFIDFLSKFKDSARTIVPANPEDKIPMALELGEDDFDSPVEPSVDSSLKGVKVFLEAGHGFTGNEFDPGAVGHVDEWESNKRQAEACQNYLKAKGANVRLELYNEGTPHRSLSQRGAVSSPTDVFVSFHNNAFNGRVQGTETLYDRLGDSDDAQLAQTVHKHLLKATGFNNRGVKKQGLGVLRGAKSASFAACLTESFFVDGPDLPLSNMSQFDKEIGESIGKGVEEFVKAKNLNG